MTWLLFSLIAGVAACALFIPLRLGGGKSTDALTAYKAQLKELAGDVDAGRIDEDAARLARLEIERRILRAADQGGVSQTVSSEAGAERTLLFVFLAVMLVGSGVYAWLGAPGVPASPGAVVSLRESPVEPGGPTFGEAIEIIENQIAQDPNDRTALEMLARTSSSIGDHSRAAQAAERLAALAPDDVTYRVQLLGSHLALARGRMSPAARLILSRMEQDFPNHPVTAFYTARAQMEDGDRSAARQTLEALKARSPADAPWLGQVETLLASLAPRAPEISADGMAAVAALSPQERQAFIRSMIDRLAARLADDPTDTDGWLRLARARFELDGVEAGEATLLEAIQKNPAGRATYQAILDRLVQNPNGR